MTYVTQHLPVKEADLIDGIVGKIHHHRAHEIESRKLWIYHQVPPALAYAVTCPIHQGDSVLARQPE